MKEKKNFILAESLFLILGWHFKPNSLLGRLSSKAIKRLWSG